MNSIMHSDHTVAGKTNEDGGRRRSLWKTPVLITALIMIFPLLGSYFIADWNWAPGGFAFLAILLFSMGLTYQLITRNRDSIPYRAAVCISFVATFIIAWGNFVQMADVNPASALYFVVPIVGVIGVAIARLRPNGMARASLVTAITQALILTVVLILLLTRKPQVTSWTPPELRGLVGNALNGLMFVGAALLFRKAGREESEPRMV